MVKVHARYRTDIVLVIVHLAILPVKMTYLIKSFIKVISFSALIKVIFILFVSLFK